MESLIAHVCPAMIAVQMGTMSPGCFFMSCTFAEGNIPSLALLRFPLFTSINKRFYIHLCLLPLCSKYFLMFKHYFHFIIIFNNIFCFSLKGYIFTMPKVAEHVPSTYVPLSSKDVGGHQLVENYQDYINSTTKNSSSKLSFFD